MNHLGHFLLVNELIDLLNQNSARIVVVSSSLHKRAFVFLLDSYQRIGFQWFAPRRTTLRCSQIVCKFQVSKVRFWRDEGILTFSLLFSYELQRRLDKLPSPHATINVVHPGVGKLSCILLMKVATGLGRHASTLSRFIFRNLIVPFIGTTADEGAQSVSDHQAS